MKKKPFFYIHTNPSSRGFSEKKEVRKEKEKRKKRERKKLIKRAKNKIRSGQKRKRISCPLNKHISICKQKKRIFSCCPNPPRNQTHLFLFSLSFSLSFSSSFSFFFFSFFFFLFKSMRWRKATCRKVKKNGKKTIRSKS